MELLPVMQQADYSAAMVTATDGDMEVGVLAAGDHAVGVPSVVEVGAALADSTNPEDAFKS